MMFSRNPQTAHFTRQHVINGRALEMTLVVVPIRHPVMTVLTNSSPHIPPKQSSVNFARYISKVADEWKTLKQNTAKQDVFFLPVDGPPENRRSLLMRMANYLSATVDVSELESTVENWSKVHSRSKSARALGEQEKFLSSGELDWSIVGLQPAIDIYLSLL